jgi:lipopolysaccharide assembly protein B
MSLNFLLLLLAILLLLGIGYRLVSRRLEKGSGVDPFVAGLEAMLRRDWKQALLHLRAAVERDSDHLGAYLKLGRVHRELGDLNRAVKIHRGLTARGGLSDAERAAVQLELAMDYRLQGRLEEALEAATKAVAADKRQVDALLARLELLEIRERWDEALDTLKRIEALTQSDQKQRRSLILVEQARQKIAAGSGRPGRILIKEALKLNAACASAYLLMGDSYEEEGRIDEAIAYWEKLPFEAPEHAALVFERLERVYFEGGRFGEMERFYTRLIEARPENPDAYLALAGFYERKGETREAVRIIDRGLEKNRDSLALSRMLIRQLARAGATERLCSFTVGLADRLIARSRRWRCRSCAHTVEQHSFRCPACHGWETLERVGDQ